MNRFAKAATLSLVAVLATSLSAAAQTSVAGKWVLTVQGPDGPADIMAAFTQDGSSVDGSFEVPMVGGAEMSEGMIEGGKLSFVLDVDIEGQWISIEVTADVDGDAMQGSFYVAEFGSMPFRGKRADG